MKIYSTHLGRIYLFTCCLWQLLDNSIGKTICQQLFLKKFDRPLPALSKIFWKAPERERSGVKAFSAYRYLAVDTFTPGPMVDTTVQDLIY